MDLAGLPLWAVIGIFLVMAFAAIAVSAKRGEMRLEIGDTLQGGRK